MTAAVVVNPLCDGAAGVRLSFEKFKKRVKAFAEQFGRENVHLTWRADPGSEAEILDLDELEKPRSGIYRSRPTTAPDDKYLEATYTASNDLAPRDGRYSLDRGYQELLDTQQHRLSLIERNLLETEARLSDERSKRYAAEDELRLAQRKIDELEALVDELEDQVGPLLDEDTIHLATKLFRSWCDPERAKVANSALDALENSDLGKILVEKHPEIILLLSEIAGDEEET